MPTVNVTSAFQGTSAAFGSLILAGVRVLLKPAFVNVIFPLTGLQSPGSIAWGKDPDSFVSPVDAAALYLTVRSIKTRGIDDDRPDVTTGCRDICISMRAESYNLSVESSELLNRVVTGLMRATTSLLLGQIGLSYMKSGGMGELSYVVDDRIVNVAVVDVWLNGVINDYRGVDPAGMILTVNTNDVVPGVITT